MQEHDAYLYWIEFRNSKTRKWARLPHGEETYNRDEALGWLETLATIENKCRQDPTITTFFQYRVASYPVLFHSAAHPPFPQE